MEHREHNVVVDGAVSDEQASVRKAERRWSALRPEGAERRVHNPPVPVAIDADRDDAMARFNERVVYCHGRCARDVMLGRTATEEEQHSCHARRLPINPSQRRPSVGRVVRQASIQ